MHAKRVFLLDGNSLVYRAYYAIRNLSNSKGFATNAIFGFFSMLRKLIQQEKPDYLGVAFDSKGPTFRHKIFKDYKATRKPMPEDLIAQIPVVKDLLCALNIPYYEMPGFEGDDLLASLACQAARHRFESVIVSHDKDLYQLVDKTTLVYNIASGIYLDQKKVEETFGVRPSQVVDVLALWGDSVDNIPGVPGVGEKTAKNLIKQFGSLEGLLENIDKVKNLRIKEQIEQHKDEVEVSHHLASVQRDIKIQLDVSELKMSEPDYDKLVPLLQELEFSSILSEYMEKATQDNEYEIILKEEQLQALIARIKKTKFVSLDTETNSPFPSRARLVGMSFSLKPGTAYYLPLWHDYQGVPSLIPKARALDQLKAVLLDPKTKKIGQNIKYDYIVLKREGIVLQGMDLDSMVLSYLIEPNWGKHNLNRLALVYLHRKTTLFSEVVGKGKDEVTMNAVDVKKVGSYACQDADLTLQLSSILWQKVREKKLDGLYRDLELPLIEVLADMEIWGVKINPEVLASLSEELGEGLDRLKRKIYEHCGQEFNINSPQQLGYILFEKLKLPSSKKTKKTRSRSTSLGVLQDLAKNYPIARDTLDYRQLAKLKSTYADALPQLINPETQRIHTSYNQTVAATGRLSSSDPNLQNIPVKGEWGPRFRQAFVPAPGHLFLLADYSQIELRVLAHLSEDPALIDTFLHDRDIHGETASRVFGGESVLFDEELRRRAKIINFSIIYGTSAFSLAKELGTSNTEAQKFIELYFDKYPKVHEFLNGCVQEAEDKGFSETLFGRIRQIPELKQKNKAAQQAGRRIALNTPIQGTAADLMKKAMIDIWEAIKKQKLKSKMILQVHDELVFEVPKAECERLEKIVRDRMENVFPLRVPVKVHLGWGVNWAEAK